MQTWAKRGIQTALVTGGLLMLGTGIASASENVNPDTPAGPLDINASIPVDISQNAIGTLGKQVNLPEIKKEISTEPVTGMLNKALAPVSKTGALKAAAPVTGALNGVTSKATDAASQAGERIGQATNKNATTQRTTQTAPSVESNGDPLMGNKVTGNVALPIQVTGNALGVLGNAEVESDSTQTYEHNSDISTSGAHGGLAGNAVALDWALPVQVSGNALGLGGSGKTKGSATQSATTTGDIATDGTHGGLAGNVVSPQAATPVQVSGNALGWFLGNAETDFEANSAAESGGWTTTGGNQSAGSGNVAAAPVALPVRVSNNGVAWGGNADATGCSAADATAGDKTPDQHGTPSYITTTGDPSFLSGNIAQPQVASEASVTGVAAAWVGNALTHDTSSESTTEAGGVSSTTGEGSTASGNIADAPVALPVEVFGVGGTWIGQATAENHDNTTSSTSGGSTFTNGDGGFLSGNSASAQPAGTAEVFGVGGSWIGQGVGNATETKDVKAGGYNGSLGNDSSGSGNVVQVPVALPAEVLGVGGSWIGQGSGTASETKTITAGGDGSTQDDHGAASANLVQVPLSTPVQAFGIGGAWIGQGHGQACTDTTSTAGGSGHANGKEGFVAGNIGAVPVSLPAQVHGIGGAWIGNGFGESENLTDSTAGGDVSTTGEGGSVAGNIVQVPGAAAATVFGVGGVWGGVTGGDATNDVASTAGGDATTNGDGGSIAGDVVSAQLLPIAQVFGDAASLTGVTHGTGINSTEVTSGGDIDTSGEGGSISGDIFDVPVAAVAQVFGVAASLGGVAHAVADNSTTGTVGGTDTTSGATKALSGINKQLPLGALVQVFDIPLGVLAAVSSTTTNATDISVAGHEPQINLPISLSELPATAMPSLPVAKTLPLVPAAAQRADVPELPQIGTLPVELTGLNGLSAVQAALPTTGLPTGPASVQGLLPHADVPAIAGLDSDPLAVFTQVTDLVTGKGIHIQG